MGGFSQIMHFIQIIFIIYLGFSALYFFIFATASLFPYKLKGNQKKLHKYAVMIPGYKEDEVILDVIEEAVQQDYPSEKYDVIVIADSYQQDTLDEIKKKPVTLIEVAFEKSTKAKALNKAMDMLPDNTYDVAVILDADNIMERDFLTKINEKFTDNRDIIQGHRIAKNINTPFSLLDAISEEINNNVFRKGHRKMGLSSALIGSAMAFRYDYFKKEMKRIHAIGGFDKELELVITQGQKIIDYHPQAYVLDEKIQSSASFSKQRKRWLAAQVNYLQKNFFSAFKLLLLKGNVDYFNKVLQFLQPPRLLILGLVVIINIFSVIFNQPTLMYWWLGILAVVVTGFLFSVPLHFYNGRTVRALLFLPLGFLLMLRSLLFHREARTKFIHTEHSGNIKKKDQS